MIKKMIKEKNYIKLIEKILVKSHFFIKEKSDISSVSLREINRFGKIYNFFYQVYLNRRVENNDIKQRNSIILSLYFCYYLKIPTTELRKEYLSEIKNIGDFIEVTERESMFVVEQVLKGKKGYAKNRALRENLFCEFICLINKEPLIICGKPGTSKSLSVHLLISAIREQSSSKEFFKQFPQISQIIPSFYQCSITSTSENIQKLFNKARKKLENNDYSINSLILMDEMGIADESKNNPLKVLHSELDNNSELEEKKKISFIGISNYYLDPSKMNRAINIVVEQPDLNYIIETSKEIAKNIDEVIESRNEKLTVSISKAYYDYISYDQPKLGLEDFHGFRDFYYLIKYIFNKISKNNEICDTGNYITYAIKGIIKNFGGNPNSIKKMKENFLKYYFEENKNKIDDNNNINYNVLDCIYENINSDIDSRYLLLI